LPFLLLFICAGCTTGPEGQVSLPIVLDDSSICDAALHPEAECSLICRHVPNPEFADLALQLANLEALERSAYTRKEAEGFFAETEEAIRSAKSLSEVTRYLMRRVPELREKLGRRVVFLSNYLETPAFKSELPICPYDRALLLAHIDHQRSQVLSLFE
jgi:hypothetical protein